MGTGRLIPFFKSQGVSRYIGFDTCPAMLKIALEKPEIDEFRLVEGDFLDYEVKVPLDLFVYAFNTPNYILDPTDRLTNRLREKVQRSDCVLELHDRRFYDPVSSIEERHQMSLKIVAGKPRSELHFQTYRRHYRLEEIVRMAASVGLHVSHTEEDGSGYLEGYYIFIS